MERRRDSVTALSGNCIYVRTLTPRPVETVHTVEFRINGSLVRVQATVLYIFP